MLEDIAFENMSRTSSIHRMGYSVLFSQNNVNAALLSYSLQCN
jgi:hypothetical protein